MNDVDQREDAEQRVAVLRALTTKRETAGLTQMQVATAMGVTESAVRDMEADADNITMSELLGYARAVGARISLHVQHRANEGTSQ